MKKLKIRLKTKKALFLILGGVIFVLLFAFTAYSQEHGNRTFSNQYLGAMDLSDLSKEELTSQIQKASDTFTGSEFKLILTDDNKTFSIDPIEVGLAYDNQKMVDNIWKYGHENNPLQSFFEQFKSIFQKRTIAAEYTINSDALNEKVKTISTEVDQPEKDFSIVYKSNKFELATDRQNGKRIDQDHLYSDLVSSINNIEKKDISFALNEYKPQVDQSSAEKTLVDSNKILSAGSLILTESNYQYLFTKNDFGSLVTSKTNGTNLDLVINDDSMKSFLEKIATSIDIKPEDSKFQFKDGQLTILKDSKEGKILDRDDAKTQIQAAILARVAKTSQEDNVLKLKTTAKEPDYSNADAVGLGIVELIGRGETNFKGSTANRVHNIKVGASALNGLILKPGDTFSTLSHLAPIDANGGYLEELVIKENETTPEFGGGLCQVSSTLFRATLNAGMKIVERSNHKYRVSYYEPPVGMDATIYDPAPDFKFQNNYATAVLIQSKVEGTKISFEIYGKVDGRKAEISEPVLSDIVPAGAPIYAETDTLPAGQSKRAEKAHDGATASFSYKVTTSSGSILQQKTFKSKYIPWPEKWLVGTGTVIPETCKNNVQDGDETGIDLGGSCPRKSS